MAIYQPAGRKKTKPISRRRRRWFGWEARF